MKGQARKACYINKNMLISRCSQIDDIAQQGEFTCRAFQMANIQRTKGAADAKRAQVFTKIAREMIVAVKEGDSGDPNNNSRLASVIAKAKAANMPNDNIKRTIEKALGSGGGDNYESITYEGYGPAGVAVIVEAMTDNRKRTAAEVAF